MARTELAAADEQAFFTIAEIANRWRCSEKKVRRVVAKGDLVTHRFGALLRVGALDLRTYERINRMADRG
jgi:excisionase family DNA binding protein